MGGGLRAGRVPYGGCGRGCFVRQAWCCTADRVRRNDSGLRDVKGGGVSWWRPWVLCRQLVEGGLSGQQVPG